MTEYPRNANPPVMTRVRWTICALLFGATTINYVDRQLFASLVPFFEDDLKLGPTDLAMLNISFLLFYGLGMMFVGRFVDIMGTKRGFGIAFLVWSAASALHGLAFNLVSMMSFRAVLGLGEAANFPASVKTVADWFPKQERALATGWFNSGSNIGALLAPLFAVAIASSHPGGWKTCFIALGVIGGLWIFLWRKHYFEVDEHPRVNDEEKAHIRSDGETNVDAVSYQQLFGMRPVYAVAVAKFFSDAPWWFYLTWLPKFLIDEFKLNTTAVLLTVPVFLVADLGAVGGGWLSGHFIKRGDTVNAARKKAMLTSALLILPIFFVGGLTKVPTVLGIPSVVVAVTLVSIAAAAHQGWSSNLFTVISDTLPKPAVARTVGISTCFGVLGAAMFQVYVGRSAAAQDYAGPFMVASVLYLFGLAGMHLILPNLKPTEPKKTVSLGVVSIGAAVVVSGILFFQVMLNRPPYSTLEDYLTKRPVELKLEGYPRVGPEAKVGWMRAQWYEWAEGKRDLIKFDTAGRPVIEKKGAEAKKYQGPTADQLEGTFR